ncbi:MAG TPA: amino acid adenylation domain-containing protein, partial [Thermoanaerobaculia bacterium]|nr:amino acid adenylation domain-containing protein [Thermoanaerobaculia bacterium]
CRDARPRVALTTAGLLPTLESAAAEIPELAAAHRMAPATEGAAGWRRPELGPEALAFLQYTSGSTSSPKGVMVSHGNLLHNEELIRQTFEQSSESVVLGWLPLYHDMGLIGTVLQPLYTGAVCYLMTPGAFLQRPARWLEAISRYRATTSGGPNFAYELCVRKVGEAEREGLDLSSWQVAFNGAEPVRAATLRRFAEAFAPCGFRASAFRPCYGLAEATLLVSGWRPEGETRVRALEAEALERHEVVSGDTARSRELVGCGAAMQTVVAVDPESGEPCPPSRIGEIWVASASVAQGYWERPEETAATFGAYLVDGSGPFLRTGDLGFVSEGEVFLTGRLKDLIILRGRNHYPQDLELTAERSHAGLRVGGGAAFAVDLEGEERLVIVHEVDRQARLGLEGGRTEEIAAAVRQTVAEEHEVSVAEVVLIGPETLPRTSSGKVRRSACREQYLQGGLRVLGASRLSSAAADEDVQVGSPDWLRRAFAAAARIDPERVDPDLPLSASGLDSLAAVELKQAVEEAVGVSLNLADLLEGMTLRELEGRVAAEPSPSLDPHPLAPSPTRTHALPGEGEPPSFEHPLSWNQRSLWFLHRLAPESSAYNIAGAARLEGVSSEALGRALQELVDRHPMLRATFADTPGGPVQRVAERAVAAYEVVEATGWSDSEVMARLQVEAYRPFDLATGPLLRAVLVRRGEEAFLAFAVHHVAADFWSMAVLARELGALLAGEDLAPLAALYTDFALRQERMLESPVGERLWEHWRERLEGAPQLDLPTDRPRRPVQSLRGGSRTLLPSLERAEAVHRLAAGHGCTPFVALLAAWQVVLSRWSGQEEFLTGAPMAGRSGREWAEVVGYFVNLVPLRADLTGDLAVRELMARTRGTVLDALGHQDLPFALLTERPQPERDLSRPPLVAAMLTYEKAPVTELAALAAFAVGVPGVRLDLGGLVLESLPLAPPAAQLDLSLTVAELPAGLAASLQWDADLFDDTTAGRMLGHLDHLLASMAAGERPVAELPLLGEAERHQVLTEWNDTAVPRSQGLLVQDLVDAQAESTPEAPAVVFQGESLTYSELRSRADQLARHLRRLGCVPESRVGVALERSLDLPVALLGVLKAGAAYVPLDPDYPRERLAFVLEDAAPQVLITQTSLRAALPAAPGATVLCLDGEALAGSSFGTPVPRDDRQLAYVLYTSGSTGRPKGVGVPHRALVNFLASMRRAPGFSPGERVLAVTSLSFDIAALEIFLPLTVGGCVELVSRAEAADGALLASRLRTSGASVLQATPATWRMLLDAGWTGDPDLRALCGGEGLPRELAASLAGRTRELWNLYGPTETTVWSAAARIGPGETGPVSIGRPISATQIHLLDRQLQTVPLGVPGELWIGGAGLARGYLGRPDLTAERFLPNPLAAEVGEPGGRLYRTGDLARHLPGGRMEVLGRIDHQVKIRGFRIELGEIEAVLTALPGVREAVVVAREGQLVAYVVGDAAAEELRRSLHERLPEYMVPSALVTLLALPLTPNGKVDRKALPAPEWQRAEGGYLAPRTPVEEVLAGIWAEVLGLERVGVTDHFFELGGHSLLATRVMSRLRSALGVEVPLRDLFAAPRLAGFAARVEAARIKEDRTGTAAPAPPLVAVPREGALPLSFAQQRLWFIDQLEPGSPLYNMPGALRAEGPLDGVVLALCLGEIVRRHETLRTVFAAPEGTPVQVIQPAQPFPLPVVDLSGLPAGAREALVLRLIREEAARPFDLTREPLLRGLLVRLAQCDHAVTLTLHHIAGDGWSLGILVREIAALYPPFAARRPSPLPELPVQYGDFAVWQRSWLHGEVLEQEIAWWRRQLAGLPPLLELPTDRPRPAAQSFRGATRPVRLPAGLTRQAEALARREGATLFMVLLAGFQTLLARYSGQDDLAVGSSVAGRNRVETEGLIGFFVNTLVLRADLAGGPTFRELLGRVRETALAAYLHQDAPFEKLVEELAPERSLAQTPLFQVMFELQNVPTASLEIQDLHVRPVGDTGTVAKFDLTLNLEERDGGLSGTMEHATDLFDVTTIDLLMRHYERLLAAAVAAPEGRVGEPSLLSAAESHQLLAEWNDTAEALSQEISLHGLFALQAARTPDAPAASFEGQTLTYAGLAARVDRLACHLRRLGCGPEGRVGVALERRLDLLVALLGVLKAGAVYVPLDPGYPRERLAFLLADSRPAALLTDESLRARLPIPTGLPVVFPAALPDAGDANDADDPAVPDELAGDRLAYVIYTSGSSGRPKGAMVAHGGMLNHLWAKVADLGLERRSRVAQTASHCFDISVWQLLAPLMAGGSVHIAGESTVQDPERLLRFVAEERITVLEVVPSLLGGMLDVLAAGDGSDLSSLEWLIVTGEACVPELARRWLEIAPHTRLLNAYGPTECSDDVTHHAMARPDLTPSLSLPIGRPVANTRIHVLDAAGRPTVRGVAGELCVAGRGVGRGYLGLPERTAQVFVPDPWGGELGSRLYRTGDLARWLADGTLEFLGRLDHQVKVRGFRIELGEIEALLATLAGVREAVVLAREDRPGDQRLVAYVVGDVAAEELRRSLREQLRERLPDYMVPATFVTLAALPLTPNGKVDRKALPLPAPEPAGAREDYAAPRTREEELLAAVWAQVLRLPRVGVNDNFFELGGDSILSVQIVVRARQAGLHFTVRQIFEHQTVAGLARHATATETAGAAHTGQGPVAGEVPLTPIQRWFFAQGFADPHHYNQALLLESREPLAPAALERAMAALVEHHDALRLRFDGGRQENAPAEPVAPFCQVDLSGLPTPHEAFEHAAAALQAGFDLSAGPLTRLCLFDAGAGQPARLFWVTHHLVVDGVSWRVLLADLEGAYRQAARGLRPSLPPKTTSFQEWACRLAGYAGSEGLARELEHWRETARIPVPHLPVDFPDADSLAGDEATVSFELGVEDTADLLATLPSVYHSRIDEALLSALVRALAGWTGSPRLRVDLEGHGREPLFDDLDLSRTVGWFTSLYPVVLEAGDAGPGEALVSAKERLRAVPGRGIGYGLLQATDLLEAAPAAEILFNYLGQVDATSEELSLVRASTASVGPSRSPRAHRTHLLEIVGIVADGRLRMTLIYGSRTHRRETVERLASAYAGALRQLIQDSRESEEVFTPSDFPKAGLDAHSFRQLASLLSDLKDVADVYPLSAVQNGMLFHSLLTPESGIYVNQATCTLPEDLDGRLFQQAWERLIERHGVLRTAFLWDGLDAPLQVVRRSCALPWQDLDWRGLPAEERQRRLEELRHSDRHTALPLDRAPLMRFSLVRLDRELAFIWTFHHLLLDGWSLPLLVQELRSVYAALREGREPASPTLPPARPFSDYIVWLQRQDVSRAEPFWRGELAGFTAPNPLGIDRPAGAEGVSSYAEHRIQVSREVTAELQALAARHKLTLQTVTLGAWAVLVSRYSSEEDVVFGNVVSGRPAALPGVETMVGMFINTLPVRARVNDPDPLISWLQRLQERQLARQDFEHSPLAQIQRWSEVPAGSPLFETLYVFENYPNAGDGGSSSLRIGDLRILESTNYPLTLTLTAADQVSLRLTSDRARVDEQAAPRLLQQLATLLAGMVEADLRLADLPLLSAAERHQLLEWGGIREEIGADSTLHSRFAARARLAPEAPALTCGDLTVTYGELHRRSNQLACWLRRNGVGTESRVGLRLDRSVDLVVGILGVLKAGAAYVPLDPGSPRERLAFVVEDAGIRFVVGSEELERLESLPAGDLEPLGDASSLAYVIYTSGSTGRPKGTLITHGNVTRLFDATEAWFGFGERDVWTLFHSYAFDFSVWEIWGALLHG